MLNLKKNKQGRIYQAAGTSANNTMRTSVAKTSVKKEWKKEDAGKTKATTGRHENGASLATMSQKTATRLSAPRCTSGRTAEKNLWILKASKRDCVSTMTQGEQEGLHQVYLA